MIKSFIQHVDDKLLMVVMIVAMLCTLTAFTIAVNFFDRNPDLYEKSLDTIVIMEKNQGKK